MTTKSFRLTDEDEKKLEVVRYQLNQAYGIDTDSGIFKFLLSQYIAIKNKVPTTEEAQKEDDLPEQLKEDIERYTAHPENEFCPNHGGILLNRCECLTNGEYITGLKRGYGL